MNKRNLRMLFFITGLGALMLACNAVNSFLATATPIPTNTPPPTHTPRPTPTVDRTILEDDFSDPFSGWGTGTFDNSSVEYENGGLRITIRTKQYITWSNPNNEIYENIHIDATARNDSTDRIAVFGIICHEQPDQSFYYLGVASDGYYTITNSTVGQDNVTLTDGTSNLIPTGNDPFNIGADCGNGVLTLYVNGQEVASAQDFTYTSGKVGLFAASNDKPNSVDVTFDDFVLTELE